MKRIFKQHMLYYLSLCLVFLASVVLVLQAPGDSSTQMLSVVMAGFFYAMWGIAHHYREHDLTAKIVVEYVLISSLGMTVVYFLLTLI